MLHIIHTCTKMTEIVRVRANRRQETGRRKRPFLLPFIQQGHLILTNLSLGKNHLFVINLGFYFIPRYGGNPKLILSGDTCQCIILDLTSWFKCNLYNGKSIHFPEQYTHTSLQFESTFTISNDFLWYLRTLLLPRQALMFLLEVYIFIRNLDISYKWNQAGKTVSYQTFIIPGQKKK